MVIYHLNALLWIYSSLKVPLFLFLFLLPELMHSALNESDTHSMSQNGPTRNETLESTSTSIFSSVNAQTTPLPDIHHQSQHDLTSPGTVPEVVIIDEGDDLKVVNDLAEQIVTFCKEHDIINPVEILRHFQNVMVYVRPLRVENVSQVVQGVTNFILVDRFNIMETAFDEIKSLTDLRKTLEVQFYGEVGILCNACSNILFFSVKLQ